MAIAYVSGSSVTTQPTAAASPPAVTVPAPSGIVTGNLLIAFVYLANTYTSAQTVSAPAGWTQIGTSATPDGSGLLYAGWKYAASEPANYGFSVSGSNIFPFFAASILQYSGIDPNTPIMVSAFSQLASGSTSAIAPSVSATAPGLWIGTFGSSTGTSLSVPTGFTSRVYAQQVNYEGILLADQAVSSGSTGTATSTIGSQDRWVASSVVLAPAAGSPTSHNGTATYAGSGSIGATPTFTERTSGAITGNGILTTSVTVRATKTIVLSGMGALSSTSGMGVNSNVGITGSGSLSSISTLSVKGYSTNYDPTQVPGYGQVGYGEGSYGDGYSVILAGSGALSGSAAPTFSSPISLSGVGALSGSQPPPGYSAAPALAGSGTLSSTVSVALLRATALGGSGNLSTTAISGTQGATGSLSGTGSLASLVKVGSNATSSLTGSGILSSRSSQYPAFTGSGSLSSNTAASYGSSFGGSGVVSVSTSFTIDSVSLNWDPNAVPGYGQNDFGTQGYGSSTGDLFQGAGTLSVVAIDYSNLSGSGTLQSSGGLQSTGSAPFAGSGALSASATTRPAGSPVLAGSGTLSTARTITLSPIVALSGSGAISSTPRLSENTSASLLGSGALGSAAINSAFGVVTISGQGALVAGGSTRSSSVVSFNAPGTLVAGQPASTLSTAAQLIGQGNLSGSTSQSSNALVGNFSSNGQLAVTDTLVIQAVPFGYGTDAFGGGGYGEAPGSPIVLAADGSLGVVASSLQGSQSLNGQGSLAATASDALSAAPNLGGSGLLAAGTSQYPIVGANLTGTGSLGSAQIVVRTGSVALAGSGALAVPSAAAAFGAQSLSGSGSLASAQSAAENALISVAGSGTLLSTLQNPSSSSLISLSGAGALFETDFNFSILPVQFSAEGALSEADTSINFPIAVFVGQGILGSVQSGASGTGSALFTGIGSVSSGTSGTFRSVAPLSGSGLLTAIPRRVASGTGILSGSGGLSQIDAAWQTHAFGILYIYGNSLRVSGYTTNGGAIEAYGNSLSVSIGYKSLTLA